MQKELSTIKKEKSNVIVSNNCSFSFILSCGLFGVKIHDVFMGCCRGHKGVLLNVSGV